MGTTTTAEFFTPMDAELLYCQIDRLRAQLGFITHDDIKTFRPCEDEVVRGQRADGSKYRKVSRWAIAAVHPQRKRHDKPHIKHTQTRLDFCPTFGTKRDAQEWCDAIACVWRGDFRA